MGVKQPWFVFSSSTGETFDRVYTALSAEAKKSLAGFFVDRECGALERAKKWLPQDKIHAFSKKNFEAKSLEVLNEEKRPQAIILLCGFFGILSKDFLGKCPHALLNTHPSLLPAFPGLDKKVHQVVFEQAHFSGFTLHLVNEELDGGAMVYQKSIAIIDCPDWESSRERVRQLEQKELPRVWDKVLEWRLKPEDRHGSSRDLLKKFPSL